MCDNEVQLKTKLKAKEKIIPYNYSYNADMWSCFSTDTVFTNHMERGNPVIFFPSPAAYLRRNVKPVLEHKQVHLLSFCQYFQYILLYTSTLLFLLFQGEILYHLLHYITQQAVVVQMIYTLKYYLLLKVSLCH